jgi:FixJ family two-component response regulator
MVLRAIERLFRSAGLTARTFASGANFLKALPDLDPACVVLDLHMPDVSGFAVLESLRRAVPVVAITGHDSPEAQQRAIVGGAVAYLRKPVGDAVLLGAVRAALASTTGPAGARSESPPLNPNSTTAIGA